MKLKGKKLKIDYFKLEFLPFQVQAVLGYKYYSCWTNLLLSTLLNYISHYWLFIHCKNIIYYTKTLRKCNTKHEITASLIDSCQTKVLPCLFLFSLQYTKPTNTSKKKQKSWKNILGKHTYYIIRPSSGQIFSFFCLKTHQNKLFHQILILC